MRASQAEKLLRKDGYYLDEMILEKPIIYNECGDEVARISRQVFDKLRGKGLEYVAESSHFWSNGYYKFKKSLDGKHFFK